MTTYKIGPRPFSALMADGNGEISFESGKVAPAALATLTPNMLLASTADGLVQFTGADGQTVAGVSLVYPNEVGEIGFVDGLAELKGWQLVHAPGAQAAGLAGLQARRFKVR